MVNRVWNRGKGCRRVWVASMGSGRKGWLADRQWRRQFFSQRLPKAFRFGGPDKGGDCETDIVSRHILREMKV